MCLPTKDVTQLSTAKRCFANSNFSLFDHTVALGYSKGPFSLRLHLQSDNVLPFVIFENAGCAQPILFGRPQAMRLLVPFHGHDLQLVFMLLRHKSLQLYCLFVCLQKGTTELLFFLPLLLKVTLPSLNSTMNFSVAAIHPLFRPGSFLHSSLKVLHTL